MVTGQKRVVLLFRLSRNGRLLFVKVIQSSGDERTDHEAVSAVERSAPFPPLSVEFKGQEIEIEFLFDYNVFGVKQINYNTSSRKAGLK